MELIKIVNELKAGLKDSGVITSDIQVIKDAVKEFPMFRDNIEDYIGWLVITGSPFDTSGTDSLNITIGISGLSSTDDDDYLQVVSKCLATLKNALIYTSYIKDEDVETMNPVVDSELNGDSVISYIYTDIEIDMKQAYGS